MRTCILLALLLVLNACRTPTVAGTRLEMSAFILTNSPGDPCLVLDLTNRGDKPQTVLTENYSESWGESNGRRSPTVGLHFWMVSTENADGKDRWNYILSLPKFAPVTCARTRRLHWSRNWTRIS